MPKAATQEENLLKICLICFGKAKVMKRVEGKLKSYMQKMFEYDFSEERLPLAFCTICKRRLYENLNDTENTVNLTIFSDLEPLKRVNTRLSRKGLCSCHICQLAKNSVPNNFRTSASKNISPLNEVSNERISGIFPL